MATNNNNTKSRRREGVTIERPCYDCGKSAEAFEWSPSDWVYCEECSPFQKQRLRFKRFEELKAQVVYHCGGLRDLL